ncbi:MAG: hypothetical protein AAF657_38245 [Acidobacteriota bacterium]
MLTVTEGGAETERGAGGEVVDDLERRGALVTVVGVQRAQLDRRTAGPVTRKVPWLLVPGATNLRSSTAKLGRLVVCLPIVFARRRPTPLEPALHVRSTLLRRSTRELRHIRR